MRGADVTGALLKYDAACQAIAEAKTVDEVTEWIDKAAAVREYGRRIKNRQIEIDAIEIRVRAKQRRGELLIGMKAQGLIREGKRSSESDRISLEELGVSKNESADEQKIAAIPKDSFERLVARCRAYAEDHPEKHSFDVLGEARETVNGARAIMGSRQEPDDSLDYFPTPPWATRALIERVFPQLGCDFEMPHLSVWEPACGEGHMAEVLGEYFNDALGSDIFEYGYGELADFLDPTVDGSAPPDWIITNPPFGDLSEAFVLKAISLARIGVAMFVRLQWLETNGRYERIFRDHPPTLISFFAERVNLCKGRWEPEGSTATAYIWLVWIKGEKPKPPFWIPPGCREALTRPDDSERFTQHPVARKIRNVETESAENIPGNIPDRSDSLAPSIESGEEAA